MFQQSIKLNTSTTVFYWIQTFSTVFPGNFRGRSSGGRRIVQRTTAKQHSCAACTSRSWKDDSSVQLMTQHHRLNESLHTLQGNGKIYRWTLKWEAMKFNFVSGGFLLKKLRKGILKTLWNGFLLYLKQLNINKI